MSGNKYKKSATELEEYQKTEDWKDDALEYLLAPLSREEIVRACSLTPKSTNPHKPTLISTVELLEPPKQIVFQIFNSTKIIDIKLERRAFVVAVDTNTERCYEAIILFNINNIHSKNININNLKNNINNSINHNINNNLKINEFGDILEEWRSVMDVQPSLTSYEYVSVEKVIKSSPILRDILKEEGYDIEKVYVDLWTSGRGYRGVQEADSGSGRRLGKPYMFYMENEGDNLYARPIRGITPVIDLNKMEIIRFDRYESKVRIPNNTPNYFESEEELIEPLKPLLISQPNGPSFKIKGHKLTWQNWEFRVGFTPKEGAIIQMASFADPRDPTNKRMVLYRGSLVEMVVPYGDPADPTYRKNAFDVGEEGIGKNINSLKRGCDCLGEISYLDAHVNDSFGDAEIVRNAICIHEEDDGLLYKHTDWRSGQTFTERSRRLIIQFFATIANYDYGFVWYFHLDGKIEYEAKLTGSVSTEMYGDQANNSDSYIFGTKVDRDVYAPIHQHFFTVRLDFNIDGVKNWVSEINPEKVPVTDPRNVQSNAFYAKEQLFKSENEAKRDIVLGNRIWRISNLEKKNRLNGSPSYLLMPKGNSHPLADPSSAVMQRATHLQHHLWVTPYHPHERFPAGEYPTQSAGGDGLIRYTQHNRSIDGVDLVVWYTFGVFHVVRPEEWPIMPITREGFHLLPFGFCDRNPRMIWKPSSFVSRLSKEDERELRADASAHDEKEWVNGHDKERMENEMNHRVDQSLRGDCKICSNL